MTKPKRQLRRPPAAASQADSFIEGAEQKQQSSQAGGEPLPWEAPHVRQDVTKLFNLRLPEPLKMKLEWLAERDPRSMHTIALEAVEEAVERQVKQHLK